MDIEQKPPWSGKKLAKLGAALVAGVDPPADCPTYGDVVEWHSDLCTEVGRRIAVHRSWASYSGEMDISTRAKTLDTLREKLGRETHLRLNQVQDLAGVRIDFEGTLDAQTALANEVCEFFGIDRAETKDLRGDPHSGYRAVHVWLRLPAGRVEVQIRTRIQSEWANLYERLGDSEGRAIRYGSAGDTPQLRKIVKQMHAISEAIAFVEVASQQTAIALTALQRAALDSGRRLSDARDGNASEGTTEDCDSSRQQLEHSIELMVRQDAAIRRAHQVILSGMIDVRRTLDHENETEGDTGASIRD